MQFDHLDVGVQEAFEKYLDERDVGAALAGFIPEFAEWKEQKVPSALLCHICSVANMFSFFRSTASGSSRSTSSFLLKPFAKMRGVV